MDFFEKNPNFWKNAKFSKFAVEIDWIIKICQNVQIVGFLLKKIDGFSKKLWFFINR